MQIQSSALRCLLVVALSALLNGCGSDSNDQQGQSGRVLQGPVAFASVFADNVSSGVRFVQDANEVSTTSDANGNFTLPSVPGYAHILVSKGGTDKITNMPAIQMMAPAGAAVITSLTTLVTLDTTGLVKEKLESLLPTGAKYDADISTTTTPAALMVSKSVEAIVQSMTNAIVTKSGSATAINATQLASVQTQIMQAIAQEFAKPAVISATLSTTATLSSTLQTATAAAATNVNTANTNIVIPALTATTIAASSVNSAATALLEAGATTASTTAVVGGEAAALSSTAAATFATSVGTTTTTAVSNITANTTPSNYTPPTIPVVTAPVTPPTGSGGTAGATTQG